LLQKHREGRKPVVRKKWVYVVLSMVTRKRGRTRGEVQEPSKKKGGRLKNSGKRRAAFWGQ